MYASSFFFFFLKSKETLAKEKNSITRRHYIYIYICRKRARLLYTGVHERYKININETVTPGCGSNIITYVYMHWIVHISQGVYIITCAEYEGFRNCRIKRENEVKSIAPIYCVWRFVPGFLYTYNIIHPFV